MKPDFFCPGAVQVLGRDPGDVFAVEPDFAGSGTIKASDQIDQRGLAGAGRTHDGQPLAGRNLERNVIQGTDDAAIALGLGRVKAADMAEFDHVILPSGC